MSKVIFRGGHIALVRVRRQLLWLIVGNRVIEISRPLQWLDRIRGLFPRCYALGLHDCDSGGHVHAWYPVMLTDRQRRKWRDMGDGPDAFSEMSLFGWVSWRIRLWREKLDYERVR